MAWRRAATVAALTCCALALARSTAGLGPGARSPWRRRMVAAGRRKRNGSPPPRWFSSLFVLGGRQASAGETTGLLVEDGLRNRGQARRRPAEVGKFGPELLKVGDDVLQVVERPGCGSLVNDLLVAPALRWAAEPAEEVKAAQPRGSGQSGRTVRRHRRRRACLAKAEWPRRAAWVGPGRPSGPAAGTVIVQRAAGLRGRLSLERGQPDRDSEATPREP